jgi:replication factor C subunit 2/4
MWTEKYRAKHIGDISSQPVVSQVMRSVIAGSGMCNTLFHGPSGTGKTSAAHAVCRALFGPRLFQDRVLDINAGDENGIAMVRDRIKRFSMLMLGAKDPRWPCPDIKVIILDEADSLTIEAQSALRNLMETSAHNTRFIMICNKITRIIDPITSRCQLFFFPSLPQGAIQEHLLGILAAEGLTDPSDVVRDIAGAVSGDMRSAINMMEMCRDRDLKLLDRRVFDTITGRPPSGVILDICDAIDHSDYNRISWACRQYVDDGFHAKHLVRALCERAVDGGNPRLVLLLVYIHTDIVRGCDAVLSLTRACLESALADSDLLASVELPL